MNDPHVPPPPPLPPEPAHTTGLDVLTGENLTDQPPAVKGTINVQINFTLTITSEYTREDATADLRLLKSQLTDLTGIVQFNTELSDSLKELDV